MTTNNHPAHGPVSLDRLHQISEILSKAAAQSDGGNIGYAMADAVKVIDGEIAAFGAEPVGEVIEQQSGVMMDGLVISEKPTYRNIKGIHKMKMMPLGTKFYTAPPAQEPMKDHQIRELVNDLCDIAVEYHGTQQLRERIARTVRSAILQAGNSPVTPDGWIPVSERMPPNKPGSYEYIVFDSLNNKAHHDYWNVPDGSCDDFSPFWNHYGKYVTHWMPLPAAPQQEVKP